ncbi:spore coat protein [Paenibacillus sp. SC116]|uniref:spore coat protein n=1 Tax=Paenibacillus sp. SC116 TaxID=2968986 RepID=UPI00215A3E63|nr:spore coat protein [Paenibacillus sp. SC116]MCR8843814.1 spore coat protein [Paenibacillus sp. SC116]
MPHASQQFLPDKDLLYTILADLKRTVSEYTTAATEANCVAVRQLFTDLTNRTLTLQGNLYYFMSQHNMYETPSPVQQKEVQKQLQSSQKMLQQTSQLVKQKFAHPAHTHQHGQQQHASHGQQHHAAYYSPYGAHVTNPYHTHQ